MKTGTVRRQLWLVLMLVGLGLLWLRSSGPDRYADLSGYDVSTHPLPVPPGLGTGEVARLLAAADSWSYRSQDDSAAIAVTWSSTQDTTTLGVTVIAAGQVRRRVEAELVDGYYPNSIEVSDLAGGSRTEVRIIQDSIYVTTERDPTAAHAYPSPKGALFEDLVLIQGMAWKGLTDSVTTHMIAFSDLDPPIRVFKVVLRPDGDGLSISASPAQTARIRFAHDSPRVTAYCTTRGDCFESRRDSVASRGTLEPPLSPARAGDAP